ncbi:MAG TPA: aromatic prenyltransferase [Actinocrinis sp.]|uniref:aromatic prenyltransferase n=1 Tax=Actinocrinis sp. TaxID=1920516 RepID=UPI002DDDB66A|nr:aromatic prenyltransferase [Actinocrinis sp.]HEV3173736.1 aromatic prenyltransferase [Actinocrinis sp.]
MPETAQLADLYSVIEESARVLGTPCSREKVWPILTAYGEVIPHATIAFRIGTGVRYAGDVDWRFSVPKEIDPYAVARANGLTPETGHPIGVLLSEMRKRCPVDGLGVDFGAARGFKKIYAFFPPNEMQSLTALIDIPSMPRSVADNLDYFARYGLDTDKLNALAIDYPHRTVNLYFGALPAECLEPGTIVSMIRELGLPHPSEPMVRLGEKAFGIYVTLNWESSKAERFCYAVMNAESSALPVPLHPQIEQFLKNVAHDDAGGRFIYYAGTSSIGEENFKIHSYFKWDARMLDQMLLSESEDNP